jgi:hypothetical protein
VEVRQSVYIEWKKFGFSANSRLAIAADIQLTGGVWSRIFKNRRSGKLGESKTYTELSLMAVKKSLRSFKQL